MANSLGNIKSLFSNVKTRTIIIITGIILFLIIVVGLFGFKRANNTAATASLKKPSNIASIPGIEATSPQYAQNQQQVNEKNYQQAQATQGTAVPTVINQQGLNTSTSPSDYNVGLNPNGQGIGGNVNSTGTGTGANGDNTGTANGNMSASEMQDLLAQQKAQLDALQQKADATATQEQQQQLQQTQSAMQQQAQQLLASWNGGENAPTQAFVQGTYATTTATSTTQSTTTNGMQNNNGSTNNTIDNSPPSDIMIKSGTILFANLDTSVNSDEPGPILATVVSGTYKGTKLIGSIQQSPEIPGSNGPTALILSFNTMNVPSIANSIGISAVAIDPDTARTALSSDVDHHYVQRYGSLFASSFLEGWGDSISQAGTNITVSPFGGTNSTAPTLTAGEQVAAGLGQVGESWGEQLGETFNRQNTVTVNAGIEMGILFLSDVSSAGNTSTVPAPMMITSSSPATTVSSSTNSVETATNNTTIAPVPPPAT